MGEMSAKQRKTCSKHVSAIAMHFCDFAPCAFEAFLWLFLFFLLPRAVHGSSVANTPAVDNEAQFEDAAADFQTHLLPEHSSVIVELFEWKFSDVAAECTNFLGPNGYTGVQLSPVTEHSLGDGARGGVVDSAGVGWLARYQPISYKFATRSGGVEEFLAMSRACNAAGVRVFVDVVLNHMAGYADDSLLTGAAGSVANVSALDYSAVPFDARDFHSACVLENNFDAYEVRNCQLDGQPDLNHSRPQVRERIVEFLNRLVKAGVAGFRIDAAKYMHPEDLRAIFESVDNLNSEEFDFENKSRPLFILEVVDLGMDAISKTEYIGNGMVTEYLYAAELSTVLSGKVPLSSLINWGPAMGFLPHQDALVFVDTHDSQHGHLQRDLGKAELLSYKQQRRHVIATAFMLAHPYGHMKRILSSYHFPASDMPRGPPTTNDVDDDDDDGPIATSATSANIANGSQLPSIRSPEFDINGQCTPASGWVCEHRWPAIVNMVATARALSAREDGVIDFQTDGPNHIAFCRGRKAFIAINNDAVLDYATTVHTCLEPGVYCDVISGGPKADKSDCIGKRIVVNENGIADLMLAAMHQSESMDIYGDGDGDEDGSGGGGGGGDDIIVEGDGQGAGGYVGSYGDDDSVWRGIDADLDYGVIAIYIDSKLPNSAQDNPKWSEVADLSKSQLNFDDDAENITEFTSDQWRLAAEVSDELSLLDKEGQGMAAPRVSETAETEMERPEMNVTG